MESVPLWPTTAVFPPPAPPMPGKPSPFMGSSKAVISLVDDYFAATHGILVGMTLFLQVKKVRH